MYCDFVVWTESAVHIQRIYPNEDFWLEKVSKVKQFFATAILPELVGKFYSRNTDMVLCSSEPPSEHTSEPGPSSVEETDTKVYCYCQSAERGTMVGCDNPECVYEWFHLECLKLSYTPKGRYWYCPDCRRLLRNNCKMIKLFILIKVYYRITHVDKSTTNVHNFI